MILPNIRLTLTANKVATTSGIDSLLRCQDKNHFLTYPYEVFYQYNSRGFRDEEWPTTLDNVIWCLGDSYTVGIGSPLEHTWVKILEQKTSLRCINVSMDGASNYWIARKAQDIITNVSPSIICMHWTYLTRREKNIEAIDEDRRAQFGMNSIDHYDNNIEFLQLLVNLENYKGKTKIVHTILMNSGIFSLYESERIWKIYAGSDWGEIPNNLQMFNNLPDYVHREMQSFGLWAVYEYFKSRADFYEHHSNDKFFQMKQLDCILDYARDKLHYGPITAGVLADIIFQLI